jgi:anaerobic magnesium-protoporphyrin IX monomethyl ester cyclase
MGIQMKVLLISPQIPSIGLENFTSTPSILGGVLYLAAATIDAGFAVRVELGHMNNILALLDKHQPDIIGFSCHTASYPSVRDMVIASKKHFPGTLAILGGHFPTFMTRDVFSQCPIDYVCRGEGEKVFPELLKHIESGDRFPSLDGIVFRRGDTLVNADSYAPFTDIDSTPAFNPDIFPSEVKFHPKLLTSRGCPYDCDFCSISAFYRGRWRERKIEDIVAEIESLSRRGITKITFYDDNFTVKPERVRTLCRMLVGKKIKVSWECMSRVDVISSNPDLIELMADAGCRQIQIGAESGVQEILNRYHKGIRLEQVERAVEILTHSPIFHAWYFIIGSADSLDQPRIIEESIEFMKNIDFDILQVSILTPFPGTRLFRRLEEENRILHRDWQKYDAAHCVYRPLHMSPQEIEGYFFKAYRDLYLSRGLDLVRMTLKGLRNGAIEPSMITSALKYGLKMAFGRRNFYEVLENGRSQ